MTSDHEPIGQVGCIDGRVLDVSRLSDVVLLTIGETEISLSTEAAALLASLLTADTPGPARATDEAGDSQQEPTLHEVEACPEGEAPDREPEPHATSMPAGDQVAVVDDTEPESHGPPMGDARQRYEIDGRSVHVRDLLGAGLLAADERLTWWRPRKGEFYEARVLETGQILLDDGSGRVFDSPSPAAMTASNTESQAGWNVWCVEDGRSLFDLRNELIERLTPASDREGPS